MVQRQGGQGDQQGANAQHLLTVYVHAEKYVAVVLDHRKDLAGGKGSEEAAKTGNAFLDGGGFHVIFAGYVIVGHHQLILVGACKTGVV